MQRGRRTGESRGLLRATPSLPSVGKLVSFRGDASPSDGGGLSYSSPGCSENHEYHDMRKRRRRELPGDG